MKARLQEASIPFSKTHDLVHLMELTRTIERLWITMRQKFERLTGFAVTFGYPGNYADRASANEAFIACKQFRSMARATLGLNKR